MSWFTLFRHRQAGIAAWGLIVFALLTVRFSPNWGAFYVGLREAVEEVSRADPARSTAITKAILSGHSERGYYVTRLAADLNAEIEDPTHKVVRWRLLFPVLGHVLGMPGWLVLGLAHLGCLALVVWLVGFGAANGRVSGQPILQAVCLGLVAGASAPFFTSMGWLGYYDSWLAVALLGVAFARWRWVVLVTCLLAPWIDERFVLGLPLALWVRRIHAGPAEESDFTWFKRQAVLPILLVLGYSLVRLKLSGTGGSQTVGDYLNQFVLGEKISPLDRLFGAWAGLGVGWALVLAAIFGSRGKSTPGRRPTVHALLFGAAVAVTSLVGSFTALDLGRSTILILPVVPLGWMLAARTAWWSRYYMAPGLAAIALLVPARHVVGKSSLPVDNIWTPSLPLVGAQNNLGIMYDTGSGVPRDSAAAAKWYRRAAEQGYAVAQNNLGLMYATGEGVPKDVAQAIAWYRRAAEQGNAVAQASLGVAYDRGDGVPKDSVKAAQWFRKSAEQGYAAAQSNLGVMYASGNGVPKDSAEAVKWYRRAAEQGNAVAQVNLGFMYANGEGVPQDYLQAAQWYRRAARQGSATAQNNLGLLYANGDGVPRDLVQAHLWFSLASSGAEENARANRVILEENMTGDELETANRRMRELIEVQPTR